MGIGEGEGIWRGNPSYFLCKIFIIVIILLSFCPLSDYFLSLSPLPSSLSFSFPFPLPSATINPILLSSITPQLYTYFSAFTFVLGYCLLTGSILFSFPLPFSLLLFLSILLTPPSPPPLLPPLLSKSALASTSSSSCPSPTNPPSPPVIPPLSPPGLSHQGPNLSIFFSKLLPFLLLFLSLNWRLSGGMGVVFCLGWGCCWRLLFC